MEKFMFEYNKRLSSYNKAIAFYNNDDIPVEEKVADKIQKRFNDIIKGLSAMHKQYREMFGAEMDIETKENGF